MSHFLPKATQMKMMPNKFVLLAATALMAATIALVTNSHTAPVTGPTPEAEKAVLARLNEIQIAAQAFDADKVFSSVMENNAGSIAQNGKVFLTRAEALDSTKRGFESLQNAGARIEYRFDQQHVTFLSSNIALAIGGGTTMVTLGDGRAIETPFAQTVVLELTNGDWKIFHAHRSSPAPQR